MKGKLMPCILDPLHFNWRALHLAFAAVPLQPEQLPAQSGAEKLAAHPLDNLR